MVNRIERSRDVAVREEATRKERKRALEAMRMTANNFCRCGGSGPGDMNACDACLIYHEFVARM